jgi:DUF1680 family protein
MRSKYPNRLGCTASGNGRLTRGLYESARELVLGDGTVVSVAETTDYPFADTVELKLAMAKSIRFPLYLRIPRWCRSPAIRINGRNVAVAT